MTLDYSFIEDFKHKELPKIKDVLYFDVLETLCPDTIDKSGKMTYKNQLLGLVKINNNPYSSFNWEVYPEDGTQDSALVFRGRVTETNVEYFTFPIYDENTNYFVMIKPLVANEVPITPPADLMPAELNIYSACGPVSSRMPQKVKPSPNTELRVDVDNPSEKSAGIPKPPFKEEGVYTVCDIQQERSVNMPSRNNYLLNRMGMIEETNKVSTRSPSMKQIFKIFYTSNILAEKYQREQPTPDLNETPESRESLESRETPVFNQVIISSPIMRPVSKPFAKLYAEYQDFVNDNTVWENLEEKYERMFDLNKLPTTVIDKSERTESSSLTTTDEEEESESS